MDAGAMPNDLLGPKKGILSLLFEMSLLCGICEQTDINLGHQVKLLSPPRSDSTSPLYSPCPVQPAGHALFQPYPARTCFRIALSALVNLSLCSWGSLVWKGLSIIFKPVIPSHISKSITRSLIDSQQPKHEYFLCAPVTLSVSPFYNYNILSNHSQSACLPL